MSQSIAKMIDGFQTFRATYFAAESNLFQRLVMGGQSPKVLVVACSDSRVDPAILTGAEPGELFVIRNVANLIPPYHDGGTYHGTRAALEFSVCGLEVEDIILLGHSRCGGIRSLVDPIPGGPFMRSWMRVVGEACWAENPTEKDDERARAMEKAALLISLRNLEGFPWVQERVQAGKLTVRAWYFDLELGELLGWDSQQDRFVSLAGGGQEILPHQIHPQTAN